MTTNHTEFQRIHLAGLQMGFGVDVSAALNLTGQELDTWLNSTEDELFAKGLQDLKEMQIERQRGYLNSGFESR